MNHPQPKGRWKPPLLGCNGSVTFLTLLPELAVPLPVLITGDLSVPGCSIEAGVPEVLLQHSLTVTRVVMLHGVDGKGVAQPVRAYAAFFTGDRVHQVAESGSVSALADDLPSAVAVDTEYQEFAVLVHRATALDVILEKGQAIIIQRQCTHPAVFLFFGYCLLHFDTALRTESVSLTQPGVALRAGYLYAGFEVLNPNGALLEVYIIWSQREGFRNTAAKMKEQRDQQPVTHIGCCFEQPINFIYLQI